MRRVLVAIAGFTAFIMIARVVRAPVMDEVGRIRRLVDYGKKA